MPGFSFSTLDNMSVPSVSVAEMREIDRIAAEETGPSLTEMMAAAGKNLSDFLVNQWPRAVHIGPIVILAGHGSNGGGGISCANHLLSRGADVRLCLSANESEMMEETASQLQRYRRDDGILVDMSGLQTLSPYLIVDAVIGYGLLGLPKGNSAALIEWANGQIAPTISLDVPSGLDVDTGVASVICIQAEKTVTLALPKTGLGCQEVGELWLSDIGIDCSVYRRIGITMDSPFVGETLIRLKYKPNNSPLLPGIPV